MKCLKYIKCLVMYYHLLFTLYKVLELEDARSMCVV